MKKLKNKWKPGVLVIESISEDVGIYLGTVQIQGEWYHEVFLLDIQATFRYLDHEIDDIWKKIK